MSARTIDLRFRAKMREFEQEMGKMPGLTKREVRKVSREWVKSMKQTEQQARRSARKTQRHWGDATRGLTGLLGGLVPGFDLLSTGAERAFDAFDTGGSSAARLAAGLGALTVAGGIGAGFVALSRDVLATSTAINEMSQTTTLTTDTLSGLALALGNDGEALQRFDRALGGATKRIVDAARGTGEAKDFIADLGIELRGANDEFRSTDEVVGDYIDAVQKVPSSTQRAAAMTALFGSKGRELAAALGDTNLGEWVDLAREFGISAEKAARDTADWNTATGNFKIVLTSATESFLEAFGMGGTMADAMDSFSVGFDFMLTLAAESAKAGVRKITSHFRVLKEVMTQGRPSDEAMQEAILAMIGGGPSPMDIAFERSADLRKLIAARREAGRGTSGRDFGGAGPGGRSGPEGITVTNEQAGVFDPFETNVGDDLVAPFDLGDWSPTTVSDGEAGPFDLGDYDPNAWVHQADPAAYEALNERAEEAHQQELRRIEEIRTARLDLASTVTGAITDVLDTALAAQDAETKGGRKAIRALFVMRQLAALSEVGVNTAAAIMQGFAMFGPPPSPLGIAAASSASVAGAVQAGVIASQKPPTGHTGMVPAGALAQGSMQPDERLRTVLTGEGVISREGVDALGGPGALHDLNRGRAPTGRNEFVVNVVELDGEVMGETFGRTLDSASGRNRRRLRRAAGRAGHRARRM